MKPFVVIILAAGLSSRMKQLKALLPLGKQTIIERLVDVFLESDVGVYIVTGYRGQAIVEVLKNPEVNFVVNPDYILGMFSSIQTGIRALASGIEAFFVMPVDIPMVRSSTIRTLVTTYKQQPGMIVYPVFEGRRGHPPLIPGNLAKTITESRSDVNLRDVLKSYQNLALEVKVNDQGILLDIDNVNDYQSLLKSFDEE